MLSVLNSLEDQIRRALRGIESQPQAFIDTLKSVSSDINRYPDLQDNIITKVLRKLFYDCFSLQGKCDSSNWKYHEDEGVSPDDILQASCLVKIFKIQNREHRKQALSALQEFLAQAKDVFPDLPDFAYGYLVCFRGKDNNKYLYSERFINLLFGKFYLGSSPPPSELSSFGERLADLIGFLDLTNPAISRELTVILVTCNYRFTSVPYDFTPFHQYVTSALNDLPAFLDKLDQSVKAHFVRFCFGNPDILSKYCLGQERVLLDNPDISLEEKRAILSVTTYHTHPLMYYARHKRIPGPSQSSLFENHEFLTLLNICTRLLEPDVMWKILFSGVESGKKQAHLPYFGKLRDKNLLAIIKIAQYLQKTPQYHDKSILRALPPKFIWALLRHVGSETWQRKLTVNECIDLIKVFIGMCKDADDLLYIFGKIDYAYFFELVNSLYNKLSSNTRLDELLNLERELDYIFKGVFEALGPRAHELFKFGENARANASIVAGSDEREVFAPNMLYDEQCHERLPVALSIHDSGGRTNERKKSLVQGFLSIAILGAIAGGDFYLARVFFFVANGLEVLPQDLLVEINQTFAVTLSPGMTVLGANASMGEPAGADSDGVERGGTGNVVGAEPSAPSFFGDEFAPAEAKADISDGASSEVASGTTPVGIPIEEHDASEASSEVAMVVASDTIPVGMLVEQHNADETVEVTDDDSLPVAAPIYDHDLDQHATGFYALLIAHALSGKGEAQKSLRQRALLKAALDRRHVGLLATLVLIPEFATEFRSMILEDAEDGSPTLFNLGGDMPAQSKDIAFIKALYVLAPSIDQGGVRESRFGRKITLLETICSHYCGDVNYQALMEAFTDMSFQPTAVINSVSMGDLKAKITNILVNASKATKDNREKSLSHKSHYMAALIGVALADSLETLVEALNQYLIFGSKNRVNGTVAKIDRALGVHCELSGDRMRFVVKPQPNAAAVVVGAPVTPRETPGAGASADEGAYADDASSGSTDRRASANEAGVTPVECGARETPGEAGGGVTPGELPSGYGEDDANAGVLMTVSQCHVSLENVSKLCPLLPPSDVRQLALEMRQERRDVLSLDGGEYTIINQFMAVDLPESITGVSADGVPDDGAAAGACADVKGLSSHDDAEGQLGSGGAGEVKSDEKGDEDESATDANPNENEPAAAKQHDASVQTDNPNESTASKPMANPNENAGVEAVEGVEASDASLDNNPHLPYTRLLEMFGCISHILAGDGFISNIDNTDTPSRNKCTAIVMLEIINYIQQHADDGNHHFKELTKVGMYADEMVEGWADIPEDARNELLEHSRASTDLEADAGAERLVLN